MITKGNKIEGIPYIVENNDKYPINRINYSENELSEGWIQDLIHKQPDILPVNDIEPVFSPLIPIGKEVFTNSGYIDNLYISPNGYLTITETKLWRNPEARREVVGQIIDYAKDLNKWTFTELDKSVKEYNQKYNDNNNGIIDTIKKNDKSFNIENQHKLIDRINKNLKTGNFLLLIAGDGIRENIEDMIDYLSKTPQLNFTLALVELQIYKFPEEQNKYLIFPQIVTRTNEITRAIVKIEGNFTGSINISVPKEDNESKKNNKRFKITEDVFFDELEANTDNDTVNFVKFIIEDCVKRGYQIKWFQSSFGIILQTPDNKKITLFIIYKKGTFYMGWSDISSFNLKTERIKFIKNITKIIPLSQFSKEKENWKTPVNIRHLIDNYNLFIKEVDNYASIIKKQF